MKLYTICTQMSCDELLCTGKPIPVGPGKYAWTAPVAATAFLLELHEPWHQWCAVYEMDIERPKLSLNGPWLREGFLPNGRITKRVWPTRALEFKL